jgi:3beta-hydroxy-delta5-steroid dehydrogenase/steroid delta-isomerase
MAERERIEHDPANLGLGLPEDGAVGAARPTARLGRCLVTGGAGFLGRHLTFELIRRGHRVRVFDRVPIADSHERLDVVQGDVREPGDVRKACEGIDTVFHTAALLDFRGFLPPSDRERSFAVNVRGVENVVRACVEAGVQRLVHTSSNGVTFGGPVLNGDESLPYVENPSDVYTETKILGEQIALGANGRGGLLTCALRPGGLYGPGDRLMLPRFVEECARGKLVARIGDGSALTENLYIDNAVDAQIEAARHLTPGSPLCGQAYFITDGAPMNYFDFFAPLVEGMGFRRPTLRIPPGPLFWGAWLWELLHGTLGLPRPTLTPLEVRNISVSHYNRIDKARRDFGWSPKVSVEAAAEKCLAYCKELLVNQQIEKVDRPHWGWWLSILSGMTLLGVLALSPSAHAAWSAHITTWTPRWLLSGVFVWAVLVHVYKGMKAVRLAERAGLHETSMAWGWQTFALGFASLRLLEQRISRRDPAPPSPS